MSEIKLLPHNEEAYNKLEICLESNQMVAVNHATGTGKSFILLKYLEKNKHKRILYLSPTYQIIDQLIEDHMPELGIDVNSFSKLDTGIYKNLLSKDMEQLADEYDIIILDEYHRCGAPKTGQQINKLLEIIKNRYPNTKVIGTTATEIRYLDNEKNMNNILFDGVCASKLSLADSILKGILPVPVYVNAIYELYETLDNIERRVRKKCFYKKNMDKYLNEIFNIRRKLDEAMAQMDNIYNYIGNSGKYLVFSSTKDKIYEDQVLIRKIFKNKVKNNFVVHSGIKKEINKTTIDKFKQVSNGNNFLYSINILNEGLHVKNVDAIFMLRKTSSPIIYFQQLGRLLSYSKRKDTVYVFDLCNNIKNNPYIYILYQDVCRRANELIQTDPKNKAFYQNILDRFKIVNVTSNICEEIDVLSEKASVINLKEERLNTSVSILEGKIPSTFTEKIQAQIDIFKFKDIINIDMFRRIKVLDIIKPKIFDLSEEEYIQCLNDKKIRIKYESENKDDNLTNVPNVVLYSSAFEKVLKQVESELQKYKNKDEYIENLYFQLLEFVKNEYRNPKYIKNSGKHLDVETELFLKKIIFYNDLEKKGYINKLNILENEILKESILNEFINFVNSHDGEFPSFKSNNLTEVSLIKKFKKIESLLSEEEKATIENLKQKHLLRVRDIVLLYIAFIKKHKRYPLINSSFEYEKKLCESYLRCEEFFTSEERQLIKEAFSSTSKKTILKNSYIEMLKNRK